MTHRVLPFRRATTRAGVVASVGIVLALVSCAKGEVREGGDSAAAPDVATATATLPTAPTTGLSTPESARYDADLDTWFVSNINGGPSAKDNNGFISRIDPANAATATKWVEGGKNGVELHAPKGMAIVGDTLWVTDIDALRGFDKRTGAAVATIDFAPLKATFLNDVAASPAGTLYLTDTGIHFDEQGNMTQPSVGRIFSVKGRTAEKVMEDEHLAGPNGIAWDQANARFVIAPFSSSALQSWREGDPKVQQINVGAGGFDGIEVLANGHYLVTSWADSSLSVGSDGTGLIRVASNLEAPADIGVDTKRGWIAVPRFNANRIDWVAVPK